ncbi:putative membrane protein [Wickerhamomyces ciferrii]|uniref:Membrane protein n=1 Tax=Wickerhamomyces ciferrii (strain ATCC 14091 / BCRC 22168 / CBS 111 / JCM 3599 / NBRC 0793 / NRRL Y-1031 F-60-10) TaxID=1206466 RepID=K0KRY7_WICCF|nr:uncharacterized protein BN7_3666 [Wickerhamomyces ciferrii]CCH44108.1 putative membrane protein [Wickerhamomyces ciferrii]
MTLIVDSIEFKRCALLTTPFEIEQQSFFGGAPKVKKIKKPKPIPVGISSNDEAVMRKVLRRAYHLDMLFNIAGYRIGYTGLIGFIPVVGDIAGVLFSLLLLKTARQVDGGLPWDVQLKFLFNILVDFLVGLIPVVGDIVEVMYKANSRNALILEKHLQAKGERNLGLKRSEQGRLIDDTRSISSSVISEDDGEELNHIKSPLKHRVPPSENVEVRNNLNVGKDPYKSANILRERTYSR